MYFSIVVPVYNAQDYLDKAVQSVLNQSFHDYELILVNDGSSDLSGKMLDELEKKDGRIKVFHQGNKGVSSARNTGIAKAEGKYLLCMDADDMYLDNTLSILFERMEEYNADFVCFGYEEKAIVNGRVEKNGFFSYDNHYYCGEEMRPKYGLELVSNPMFGAVWSKAYKMDIIRKNKLQMDEQLYLGEDYCFNLEMLRYSRDFQTIELPVYCYVVQNENSIIQKYNQNKFEQMYRMHLIRKRWICETKCGNALERLADIRYNFIRLCMSCFMDLSRFECTLNFWEQLSYIKGKKCEEKEAFHVKYLKYYSTAKKLIYILFSTQNTFLIWMTAKFSFYLKFKLGKKV